MKKLLLSIGILLCAPSLTVCRPKNSLIQSIIGASTGLMGGYLFYKNQYTSQGNAHELCIHATIGFAALTGFCLGFLMQEDIEPKVAELERKIHEMEGTTNKLQEENAQLKNILSQNIVVVNQNTKEVALIHKQTTGGVSTIPKSYKAFSSFSHTT